jgi:ParB family transcriptional regulator, chromosome partitioning protein
MNIATLHETTAIAAAVAAVTAAQELLLLPLSKLRPSSRNVRKSGGTSIPELAASIARVGLLQNLNVVLAADGEHYEVVAGRRRLAALKLLVKRRKLAKDFEVPCLLGADAAARTVSARSGGRNCTRWCRSPAQPSTIWSVEASFRAGST